jgi:hypothetical protein
LSQLDNFDADEECVTSKAAQAQDSYSHLILNEHLSYEWDYEEEDVEHCNFKDLAFGLFKVAVDDQLYHPLVLDIVSILIIDELNKLSFVELGCKSLSLEYLVYLNLISLFPIEFFLS